jgi:hypothetical protein
LASGLPLWYLGLLLLRTQDLRGRRSNHLRFPRVPSVIDRRQEHLLAACRWHTSWNGRDVDLRRTHFEMSPQPHPTRDLANFVVKVKSSSIDTQYFCLPCLQVDDTLFHVSQQAFLESQTFQCMLAPHAEGWMPRDGVDDKHPQYMPDCKSGSLGRPCGFFILR